jgi:hypothetical protein
MARTAADLAMICASGNVPMEWRYRPCTLRVERIGGFDDWTTASNGHVLVAMRGAFADKPCTSLGMRQYLDDAAWVQSANPFAVRVADLEAWAGEVAVCECEPCTDCDATGKHACLKCTQTHPCNSCLARGTLGGCPLCYGLTDPDERPGSIGDVTVSRRQLAIALRAVSAYGVCHVQVEGDGSSLRVRFRGADWIVAMSRYTPKFQEAVVVWPEGV